MELKKSLYSAFIKFQQEFKGLKPDGNNPFFKSSYITLDGILETVRPILAKFDLAVMQEATGDGEFIFVKTILVHSSGESFETDLLKMKPQKNNAQEMGSCITYAKRYQLGALLGICESVDDDGNNATFNEDKPKNNNSKSDNKKVEETQSKKIGELEIKSLQELIDRKGTNAIAICQHYKVNSLVDMTMSIWSKAINGLNAKKDVEVKQNDIQTIS